MTELKFPVPPPIVVNVPDLFPVFSVPSDPVRKLTPGGLSSEGGS